MIKIKFINVLVSLGMSTKIHKQVMEHEVAVLEEIHSVELLDDVGEVREVDAGEEYGRLQACYGNDGDGVPYVQLAYGRLNTGGFEKALTNMAAKKAPASPEALLALSVKEAVKFITGYDQAQCEILLALEKDGEARKGIINALEERIGEVVTA